jgi:hypothetical protein
MTDDSGLHHLATGLTERRCHWHDRAHHRGFTGEGGSTSLCLSSCDALCADRGHALHADITETSRRANTDSLVKAMTDGEMNVRDMVSSLINQTALATSEDLRRGMLWPLLVSPRVQMMALICNGGLGSA